MRYKLLLLAIVTSVFGYSQQPAFITDSLDQYIRRGMKDWDISGLAIVIVKDGKPVLMKGYGQTAITDGTPVDANTLFMIASNSKLFTGTILANLETQKRLNLNDKITRYFPDYRLYDSITTASVTIRDMLTHRIGTKTFQGDFTFWNSTLTSAQIMNKMRLLKPVGLYRQDYGYCNSCFLTAGEVIPKVTGRTWGEYVQDSILTPLDMKRSSPYSKGIETKTNVAQPYTTSYTGTLRRVPYDQWDNLGPAASIVSSVNDLSHWLLFQLDSGRYEGKRLMPFSTLQKTRDINIITSSRRSAVYPINFRGYGLGLFAADYNGRQLYWHTGGAGGMVSNVSFVPSEKLGIAILTNNDNQSFFEALRYQVTDAYLGVPYTNRSSQLLGGFRKEMEEQLKEIAAWKARVKGSHPDLPLAAYTGSYSNAIYGKMNVSAEGNRLKMKFNTHPNLTATLDYMDNGEWLMQYDNVEYGVFAIKFVHNASSVISVMIRANEFVEYDPYIFNKD